MFDLSDPFLGRWWTLWHLSRCFAIMLADAWAAWMGSAASLAWFGGRRGGRRIDRKLVGGVIFLCSPRRKLRKWSHLTSIYFFKWVGEPTTNLEKLERGFLTWRDHVRRAGMHASRWRLNTWFLGTGTVGSASINKENALWFVVMLGEVDLFLCGMSGRTTKFRREISYLVFFLSSRVRTWLSSVIFWGLSCTKTFSSSNFCLQLSWLHCFVHPTMDRPTFPRKTAQIATNNS